jgi:murein peptide amidase A
MAPASDDPYQVLGVPRSASRDEIRSAFRRLALRHHPDLGSGDGSAGRMAALNRAYAILSDPERRRRYDAESEAAQPDRGRAPTRPPTVAEPEARPWTHDLDGHADDWRQMYEEERQLWEQLLAAKPAGDPGRAGLEAALDHACQEQLVLENAVRARAGLPPFDRAAFEAHRARERAALIGQAHAAGCFGLLAVAWAALLGVLVALLALAPAVAWADPPDTTIGTSQAGEPLVVHHLGDGPKRLLIIGGQHGGPEANTVELVTRLEAHFRDSPDELPSTVGLDLLPVANPDGLALGVRQYLSGVDPNRNWGGSDWQADGYDSNGRLRAGLGGSAPFSEPETQALAGYVLQTRPAFVINYHSAGGFLFGPRGGPGADEAAAFADASGYYWPTPGAPSPLSYRATGSMNVWLRDVGVPGILVELTSARNPELDRNLAGVRAVLAQLAAAS